MEKNVSLDMMTEKEKCLERNNSLCSRREV